MSQFPARKILLKDVETARRMSRQGCPNGDEGQKENRAQACDTKTTQPEQKTDREVWLKLVGFDAFMDLKKREDRSLMALDRDNGSVPQHLNSVVIRMLGFPTSCERLLEWLRANRGEDFESMEIKQLKQEKTPNLNGMFANNKLASLPKEIGDLKQLEKLDLRNNQLTSLPKEIGNLKQLEELYLGGNKLTSLPEEIGDLKQLEKLDLRNNQLTSLPKEIGDLKQLKVLYLNYNELTSLPKEIGNLKQLEKLWLYDNKLASLPKEIGNLKQLKELHLIDNELTSLPKEIGNLKQLEELYLGGNKLTSLPEEIGDLKQLERPRK